MKRKISLIFCILALVCVFALGTAAAIYEPDSDGTYSVELEMQADSEYFMLVLKGRYDQTNYIEAYNGAKDSDIIYFEQKASDEDGKVAFGPFVPFGYYDATVILGGTNLDEPYLAGYLSVEGVSNSASIAVSGIEASYTVKGEGSEDYVIRVGTQLFDSFGYPSLVEEKVNVEIENYTDGVSVQNGVVTISKNAKAQHFNVVVTAGDAEKSVLVQVLREESVKTRVEVYSDEACTQVLDELAFSAVAGNIPEITVYAKTFDQYGDEIEDEYTYTYGGEKVDATFTPDFRIDSLIVSSTNASVNKEVVIAVNEIPDYKDSALELYELINECKEIILGEKNISSTGGKEFYPDETWTTQSAVNALSTAVNKAQTALDSYGTTGNSDSDYADDVNTLTKALDTYYDSFKAGIRKDIETISIEEKERIIVIGDTLEIAVSVYPKGTNDVVTWTSSDTNVAIVTEGDNSEATIKGVGGGTVTITATTKAGLTASAEVTVIKEATGLLFTYSATSATFGGEAVKLLAKMSPVDTTDVVDWTFDESIIGLEYREYTEGVYKIVEATVVPKANGKTNITVKTRYSGETMTLRSFESIMPDWEKASAPVASVESGSVLAGTEVALSSKDGSAIYYTLDGSTPTKKNGRLYRGPIAVGQSLTLKAIAVGDELYDSDVVTYDYTVVDTSVSVSSAVARAGDEVEIIVKVSDFADVEWAGIAVNFDPSVVQAVKYSFDDKYSIQMSIDETYVSIDYKNTNGAIPDGQIAVITFKVNEQVPEGEYPFITTARVDTADKDVFDAAVFEGAIVVNNYILGDANNDGKVTLADVLMIQQYAAGKESAVKNILLEAADVDADGIVNEDDALLVSKYCVGWDVTFGKQHTDDLRIVSNWNIDQDADGEWRIYYELINPFTGAKEYDVASERSAEKSRDIGTGVTEQTFVTVSNGFVNDEELALKIHVESKAEYSIDETNLVWIAEVNEDSTFLVVPYNEALTSAAAVREYVEALDENGEAYAVTDIYGHALNGNTVEYDKDTPVSVIAYDAYNDDMWKYGTFDISDMNTVANAGKSLLCYNQKAIADENNGEETTRYSEFVKAYISVDHSADAETPKAEYIIVVVNDNEGTVLYK